jgi:ankyrin repeat protein
MSKSDYTIEVFDDRDMEWILPEPLLTDLDLAVINNNSDGVIKLIASGASIYQSKFPRLCNGYLIRKWDNIYNHENGRCINNVCNKNPMYYALLLNYNLIKQLKATLEILSTRKNLSDKIIQNTLDILGELKNINCGCNLLYPIEKYYVIHELPLPQSTFKKIGDLCSNLEEFREHFEAYKTTLYQLPNLIPKLENPCLYAHSNIKIHDIYHTLISLYSLYITNVEIICLLFNQQVHEVFVHCLIYNPLQIIDITKKLYIEHETNSVNKLLDINFNNSEGKTILMHTLSQSDNVPLVNLLLDLGCRLPNNINSILSESLEKNHYQITELLLKTVNSQNLIEPIDIPNKIILSNLEGEGQVRYLDIICHKENIIFTNKFINGCLVSDNSLVLLKNLSRHKNFINNFTYDNILYCIKTGKHEELDIILENSSNLEEFKKSPLLFDYINLTTDENDNNIKVLDILLKHEIELNNLNKEKNTGLILLVLNNRPRSLASLIEHDCNTFIKNIDGLTPLHLSIMHNNINITKLLLICSNKEDKYLVNEPCNNSDSPIMLALQSDLPIDMTKTLLSVDEELRKQILDVNYVDKNGNNILDLIIMDNNLTYNTKIELFNIYFTKNIDLTHVNNNDFKPVVVRAVEQDMFEIVVLIMNKLIELGEINVGYPDIVTAVKSEIVKTVTIKNKNNPNFYSLVLLFIKQNLYKAAKPVQTIKQMDNLISYVKPEGALYDLTLDKSLDENTKKLILNKMGKLVDNNSIIREIRESPSVSHNISQLNQQDKSMKFMSATLLATLYQTIASMNNK